MQIAAIIVVFILVWWSVFFCVLPWGNAPADESERQIGTAPSAPRRPRLGLKIAITTALAVILSGVVIWLINIRLVDWREKADALAAPPSVSLPASESSR